MGIESKRAKRWFKRLSESRHMFWLLGTLSFLETIVLPVPIEVVLIPLMAANRERIWMLAAVTTAGCLVASVVGYGVGMVLYESLGTWFIETMGMESAYESFQDFFDNYGFVAILTLGVLPIPFQVAMITAGLSGYPIYLFVLAAVLARGARYFGLAWLVRRYGDRVEEMWRRHALLTSLVAATVIVALALGTRWLANQVM
ncbi:VTT domain-containing protein [Halomonas denitrificans]|nr:VTT domain-containing protein [Halomonas denitrificans]